MRVALRTNAAPVCSVFSMTYRVCVDGMHFRDGIMTDDCSRSSERYISSRTEVITITVTLARMLGREKGRRG